MYGGDMTSTDLYVAMEEADSAWFGSLSERCIYHYLLFHADKKGVFRLAMTELASVLDVKRQTVQKHVDSLIEKRLVRRVGHGRPGGRSWTRSGQRSASTRARASARITTPGSSFS
jgi:predicted ArsR family transcriptional regulator